MYGVPLPDFLQPWFFFKLPVSPFGSLSLYLLLWLLWWVGIGGSRNSLGSSVSDSVCRRFQFLLLVILTSSLASSLIRCSIIEVHSSSPMYFCANSYVFLINSLTNAIRPVMMFGSLEFKPLPIQKLCLNFASLVHLNIKLSEISRISNRYNILNMW